MEEAVSEVDFQLKVDLHFTDSEQQWVSWESFKRDGTISFAQPFSNSRVSWEPWTSEPRLETWFLISWRNVDKEYVGGNFKLCAF